MEGSFHYKSEATVKNWMLPPFQIFKKHKAENKHKEILSINEIRKQQIIIVPEDKMCRYNFFSKDKENESSTILIYFQIDNFYYNTNNIINQKIYEEDIKYKCLLFVINSMFYESFYDELRTKQQVGCGNSNK